MEIAEATGEKQHYDLALQAANNFKDAREKSEALLEIVKTTIEKQYYDLALQVANNFKDAREKSMALLEIAEATGVNQHFEQALQVTYGINCDWERTRTLVEIAEATGNSKLFGDELLHFISNVPIQHHKWEILDGLVKSMQAPDLFQMLQRWYQQEQESLSSQTKMRLFQRVTNETLRSSEFPQKHSGSIAMGPVFCHPLRRWLTHGSAPCIAPSSRRSRQRI